MDGHPHYFNLRKKCKISFDKIEDKSFLWKRIGALYLDQQLSDIILVVENEKLFAHKIILAACSEYFRALLFGGMRESSQDEIIIPECKVDVFKALLKFIYTGIITSDTCRDNFILEMLESAHRFGFVDLENAICNHLKETMTVQNCCLIHDTARLYNLINLLRKSELYIDEHAEEVLSHDSFLEFSSESLKSCIKRDSFFASEVVIFKSILRWLDVNKEVSPESQTEMLNAVRLPLMNVKELMTAVKPTGLVSPIDLLHAIEMITVDELSDEINYRGVMRMEYNMAVEEEGANVLKGKNGSVFINGKLTYDPRSGYTSHTISEDADPPFILIELGTHCLVNYIKMWLCEFASSSYSYTIEVSTNQKNWTKVVDHSQHLCRSWQHLYFYPKVVKYVKIIGTNNIIIGSDDKAPKAFHAVHFEIMYTNKPYVLDKMLSVPKHNVATLELGALVLESATPVSTSSPGYMNVTPFSTIPSPRFDSAIRIRNSLLDGNTILYLGGCTSHELNKGCILIQLGQPYMIESMRLLLWSLDHAMYSYFIEVSVNNYDWEIIVDKTGEECSSWQTLHFERRPVVFIRITGTRSTKDNSFRVVHFECPAQIKTHQQLARRMPANNDNEAKRRK